MQVEITNQRTYITETDQEELAYLRKLLTYAGSDKLKFNWQLKKYEFNPNYTRICLLEDESFPAGLTGLVKSKLVDAGFTLSFTDKRVCPVKPDLSLLPTDLRYYQIEGNTEICKPGRGILKLPTGAGKTRTVIGLISIIPTRWLFIAPREGLITQTAKEIRKQLRLDPRIFGSNKGNPAITLATTKMLYSRRNTAEYRELMSSVGGVIMDECHTAGADMAFTVLMDCQAYYRIGLSATPYDREDGAALRVIGALGRVVYEQPIQQLIADGYLAKPIITMHECSQTFTATTYIECERKGIVLSNKRNERLLDIAKISAYPALLFVTKKNHGKRVNDLLKGAGLRTLFVWGDTPEVARQQALKDLQSGKLQIVVCSTVWQEGVDLPCLDSVINGSGQKSVTGLLQKMGRGTRIDEGKTTFEVHDILDTCLSDPETCGNRYNSRHSQERLETYRREGHEVSIKYEKAKV